VTPDPTNQKVLNPDNLADYMINSFETGSFDAPMSTFLANASNNWFGMMDRTSNNGFVFFAHDHEHGMATDQDGRSDNRVGPWGGLGTNAFGQGMYNTNNSANYANPTQPTCTKPSLQSGIPREVRRPRSQAVLQQRSACRRQRHSPSRRQGIDHGSGGRR
jgi:hypothetical protein